MSELGHSRLSQSVLSAARCPLPSENDLSAALQRNDAMGQKAKFLDNQRTSALALKVDVSRVHEYTP